MSLTSTMCPSVPFERRYMLRCSSFQLRRALAISELLALLIRIPLSRRQASTFDGRAKSFVLEKQRGVVGAQVSPLEIQAAIHEHRLARYVARQVRQEEQDGTCLLIRVGTPSHGNGLAIALHIFIDVGACAGCDGCPGGDSIDANVIQRQLDSQCTGNSNNG